MVPVLEIINHVLREQGRTQAWVIRRMNELCPQLQMNKSKFSSIMVGRRKIYGDELIVLCKVLEITLDQFMVIQKEGGKE